MFRVLEHLALGAIAVPLMLAGCSTDPSGILIQLAPDVVSSQDGTIHVKAMVLDDRSPLSGRSVDISVSYVDRNGDAHDIDGTVGETGDRGTFEAVLEGFIWEGSGTVTATVLDGDGAPILDGNDQPLASAATFAVLDRTPPTVTILPPTADLHVGAGFPLEVSVLVTDEIGISEVFLEASGEIDRLRSTVVASGSTEATVRFDFDVPGDARSGPTITLFALASDLSGNQAAAEPVVLTVDPALAFAVTQGLEGTEIIEGNQQFLDDPRAIAVSPKDGLLYVADASAGAPCNGKCIRTVNPADSSVSAGVIASGVGDTIEGIAFDATGDNLYYSDRQNRLYQMAYNGINAAYENPTLCVDEGAQSPQDPFHLVYDPTLGIVVADQNDKRLKNRAVCNQAAGAADFTGQAFESPWGIAAANGEFYVSDNDRDRIYVVDADGNTELFESEGLDQPRGVAWLTGGVGNLADSLMIANYDGQRVTSSTGDGTNQTVVYLRNDPVDVDMVGTTMYIATAPSNGDGGRIIKVTGF